MAAFRYRFRYRPRYRKARESAIVPVRLGLSDNSEKRPGRRLWMEVYCRGHSILATLGRP
ncbi:MAG: hypothetical protein IT581_20665 [Verrucomicrobiales bacterium]|nr:hypothetical protein [Verrucomicrobiales bacterium]